MEINHLREFIILSQTLNFSKTAEIVYISQSVLSKHMARLEKEIGTKLLVHNKHKVKFTKSGEFFLKEIKIILDNYDDVINKIKLFDTDFMGELGIGMLYYSKEIIVPAIERFKKEFPYIKLNYFSRTPNEVANAIFEDSVDVGALMNIKFQNSHQLTYFDLYKEPLVLMVNYKHPLAGQNSISILELKNEIFVNVNDNFYRGYFNYIKKLCIKNGFEPKDPKLVENYEMLLLTVQSESGVVAVLTSNMKKQSNPNTVFINIENEDFFIIRSIIYKTKNTNPAIPLFLEKFKLSQ
jgi:DNA-binding transcriptional LysR family regulator